MAYLNFKSLPAIALSGLTGAGTGFVYSGLLLGLSPLPEAITLCYLGIFPILGGWLSLNTRDAGFFPISILIGISVAFPAGNDTYSVLFVLASALWQGTLATVAFVVGWGARLLLVKRCT